MLSQLLPMLAISFAVFVLFFIFMGLGYLFKKQPLKGSCGGVANLMGDETCQFCGNDPNKCDSLNQTDSDRTPSKAAELGKSAM